MTSVPSVNSEERVFSLLLALASSQHGVTKTEILRSVHGYAQKFDDTAKRANLERQFERDKDALRQLGIPIETFEGPLDVGNNQVTRYRIALDSLALAQEVVFDDREISLLRLASFAWRDSTLAGDARLATIKLASLGNELDTELYGVSPAIHARDAAFEPLRSAIDDGVVVEFHYRKAAARETELRRVAPLALEKIEGRWHLISWDYARESPRVFLLSRIIGNVRLTEDFCDPKLHEKTPFVLDDLRLLREKQVAKILRRPGSEAESRITEAVHYLDEEILADELLEFGADVFVLEPASLKRRVKEKLRSILDLHQPRVSEQL